MTSIKTSSAPRPLAARGGFDLLLALMIAMIVYIPNQTQLPIEFSIKGLNITNLLFLGIFFTVSFKNVHSKTSPPLKGAFFFFFFVLTQACLMGWVYDAALWIDDFTVLKNMILLMLLYFLFYRSVQDLKTLRLLLAVILLVTLLASVQGVRQALAYGLTTYNEHRRVTAPFGWHVSNANRAAVFFCIFMPVFAALGVFYKSNKLVRIFGFLGAGLCIFVVFFTYSRQSYFILAVLVLFLTFKRKWVLAVLIMAVLANYPLWAPDSVVDRLQSTKQEEDAPAKPVEGAGEGKYDESTESRFVIWAAAGELIAGRPLGIGLNHFKREIGTYAPRYQGMDAHNNYVLITTEAGILGPVAMVVMLIGLLALGRRVEKLNDSVEAKVLGVGFTGAVIAVMMGNIYGSRFFDPDVMGNFWILAALVARYCTLQKEEQKPPAAKAPGAPVRRSIYA